MSKQLRAARSTPREATHGGGKFGFTLVELLVVIAIIGILIALLLPAVQAAREAARRSQCSNNLKQLGLGLHNYHDVHRAFPPGYIDSNPGWNSATGAAANKNGLGWGTMILPYIEQTPLFNKIKTQTNNFANHWMTGPIAASKVGIPAFVCPSDRMGMLNKKKSNYGKSNYLGNGGNAARGDHKGVFWADSHILMRDIADGTSNTLMVVESSTRKDPSTSLNCGGTRCDFKGGLWIGGRMTSSSAAWHTSIYNFDVVSFGGGSATYMIGRTAASWGDDWISSGCHPGGLMTVRCDGSVKFISKTINMLTYRWLRAREDGQVVGNY